MARDALQVKAEESSGMDRLEAALDLGAADGRLRTLAASAALSLAGAADVAVLAWDRAGRDADAAAWAAELALRHPLPNWLEGRARNTGADYGRAVPIPASPEEHLAGKPFALFQDEAATELARRGMPRSTAYKILGAFAEMAGNAVQHSQSPVQPFATFEVSPRWWEFSVTDFGLGIPNSLRSNRRYVKLNDREAVAEALKDGVSRFDDPNRGTGYGVMLRALAEHECVVRLRTGYVVVHWTGEGIGLTGLVYELAAARVGLHLRVAGSL